MPRVSMGGALARAFAGYNQGQDQRRETEEREKRSALQQAMAEHEMKQELARAQMQREQFEYGKGQDAREWERRDQLEARRQQERTGEQLAEQGQMILPGGFGRVKVGPSKLEQAMAEREAANRAKLEAEDRDRKHDIEMLGRRQSFEAQQSAQDRAARGQGMTRPGRIIPGGDTERIGAAEGLLDVAYDAQGKLGSAIQQGVKPTGMFTGRLAAIGEGLGMADTRAVSARAALANVASELMKARSGGAITPQEFERLQPFIPSKNDDEAIATQKLTDLIGYLETMQRSRLDTYEDAGYRVDDIRARSDANAARRKQPKPSIEQIIGGGK